MAWIYKPKRKYDKDTNRQKRQDIYNTTLWKRMRLSKLMRQPMCEVCLLEDKSTLAEHCHHLVSFMEAENEFERDALAYDSNNLISVCQLCHNRIHNGDLKGCKSLDEINTRLHILNNGKKSL